MFLRHLRPAAAAAAAPALCALTLFAAACHHTDTDTDNVSHTSAAATFDWGSDCAAGSGTFAQEIAHQAVVKVGDIPINKRNVSIQLTSPVDTDIQLYDVATGHAIIAWPNGDLSGPGEACTQFEGTTYCYSGYNGDGTNYGNERIWIEGDTNRPLRVSVYGYSSGVADVVYSWEAVPTCNETGDGEFNQYIPYRDTTVIGDIPPGKTNLLVELKTDGGKDVDVQLIDKSTGREIIAWPSGDLSGPTESTTTYEGMQITYSGYNGVGGNKGHEWIRIKGTTTRELVMRAYGYVAGTASVTYSWGQGVGTSCAGDSSACLEIGLACKPSVAECHAPNWCGGAAAAATDCGTPGAGGSYVCHEFECIEGLTLVDASPSVVAVDSGVPFRVRFSMGGDSESSLDRFQIYFASDNPYRASGSADAFTFPYKALANGIYEVAVTSQSSDVRELIIEDTVSGDKLALELRFEPGAADHLAVIDSFGPGKVAKTLGEHRYLVSLVDVFDNPVKGASFSVVTSFGASTVTVNDDGSAEVLVSADGYGTSDVTITASHLGATFPHVGTLRFDAVELVHAKANVTDGADIDLPIATHFPQAVCDKLDRVHAKFTFAAGVEVRQALVNESFFVGEVGTHVNVMGQTVVTFDGRLRDDIISQGGCKYPAGGIRIGPITPGKHEILVGGSYQVFLRDGARETATPDAPPVKDVVEDTCNDDMECKLVPNTTGIWLIVPGVITPPSTNLTGKPSKSMCLDFIVGPAAQLAWHAEINAMVTTTIEIFRRNAATCNCPYFLNISSYTVNSLDHAQWKTWFHGKNRPRIADVIKWLRTPTAPHHRRENCTVVFVSDLKKKRRGVNVHAGGLDASKAEDFIVLDHVGAWKDSGRTLAHEIGHNVSGGKIMDSRQNTATTNDAARAQGAKRRNNLYNYRNGNGTAMTRSQCNLIDWNHARFSTP